MKIDSTIQSRFATVPEVSEPETVAAKQELWLEENKPPMFGIAPEPVAVVRPLTFGKVFWAIVLGNLCSALLIGLIYAIATAK
jgi:hypothetical protein